MINGSLHSSKSSSVKSYPHRTHTHTYTTCNKSVLAHHITSITSHVDAVRCGAVQWSGSVSTPYFARILRCEFLEVELRRHIGCFRTGRIRSGCALPLAACECVGFAVGRTRRNRNILHSRLYVQRRRSSTRSHRSFDRTPKPHTTQHHTSYFSQLSGCVLLLIRLLFFSPANKKRKRMEKNTQKARDSETQT